MKRSWTWLRAGQTGAAAILGVILLGTPMRVEANDTKTTKNVTYQVENDKDNTKPAKGYAVFVDVKPENIDTTKTTGKILNKVRLEPRPPLGTLIVFENPDAGIPPGKRDDIQIHFKDLPKAKKDVRFSNVSTLRSGVGRDAPVIQEEVGRIGFKAEKDPEYTILNALDQSPFWVTDLQMLVNVDEIVDTAALLDFSLSYGFSPLPPETTYVDALSSPMIPIPGTVDLEKWFYVRGIADIDGVLVPFLHGQSEFMPVPESSGPLLLSLGVLALAGYGLGSRAKPQRDLRRAPVAP